MSLINRMLRQNRVVQVNPVPPPPPQPLITQFDVGRDTGVFLDVSGAGEWFARLLRNPREGEVSLDDLFSYPEWRVLGVLLCDAYSQFHEIRGSQVSVRASNILMEIRIEEVGSSWITLTEQPEGSWGHQIKSIDRIKEDLLTQIYTCLCEYGTRQGLLQRRAENTPPAPAFIPPLPPVLPDTSNIETTYFTSVPQPWVYLQSSDIEPPSEGLPKDHVVIREAFKNLRLEVNLTGTVSRAEISVQLYMDVEGKDPILVAEGSDVTDLSE